MMTMKSFRLDDETLKYIRIIKETKGLKSEKDVVVTAIEQYMLSEMIEHESLEFQTFQRMSRMEDQLKRLSRKMEYIDQGVSINNLFLASDFEVNRYPKGIINRDTFDGFYFTQAKKEILKMIRMDKNKNEKKIRKHESEADDQDDDSWLDV